MNKKRLSVVMAGAMLASSVAPVLAAEEVENKVELTAAQKGELAESLTRKIWAADKYCAKDAKAGQSIYGIQINDAVVKDFGTLTTISDGSETKLLAAIKAEFAAANGGKGLLVGDVVKLVNLGVDKRGEELYSEFETATYTEAELNNKVDEVNSITDQLEALKDKLVNIIDVTKSGYSEKGFTLKYKACKYTNDKAKDELLTTESARLDFNYYYSTADKRTISKTADGAIVADNFYGFVKADPMKFDVPSSVVEATEITSGGDTYKLRDLYDGLFLTTKGYELLNDVKEDKAILAKADKKYNKNNMDWVNLLVKVGAINKNANGKYEVKVEIANAVKLAKDIEEDTNHIWDSNADIYDVYHIVGDSEPELETLVKWLANGDAAVDKIEGEDRYTTAVKLAKEVGLTGGERYKTEDIVLVNGSALVDGLAAAPLAGYLSAEHRSQAPILLTAKNELPKATQRYLRELIDLEANKEITVHIVGGESVVSDNVKRQLRALGLNVERYAGEDRESTSMAVAKEIGFENGAFVIGAKGEADAMSISGFAASKKAPVIVSGFDGLSEETIDMLDGVDVSVIGGESRISKAEYEEIEAVAEATRRISGEDRKATNAAVINKFYKNNFRGESEAVIVAKDDVLVDALAAANLASVNNAPIVLGTKSLSNEQIHAVVQNANKADKVYQIGGGVERNVVKVVAEALKLVNN